jgi:hypothetical protein
MESASATNIHQGHQGLQTYEVHKIWFSTLEYSSPFLLLYHVQESRQEGLGSVTLFF